MFPSASPTAASSELSDAAPGTAAAVGGSPFPEDRSLTPEDSFAPAPAFLLQTLLDNSAVIDFLAAVQPAVIEGSAPPRLLRDRYDVASEDVEPQPEPE